MIKNPLFETSSVIDRMHASSAEKTEYWYHKIFSFFLTFCFFCIVTFFLWNWLFQHGYKNYYYSPELKQFVGEPIFLRWYPLYKKERLLNQMVFEYLRGPVDPFLRNPLTSNGNILSAISMERRIVINLSGKILSKIDTPQKEELVIGSIILTFQSSSIIKRNFKEISFVFSGRTVHFIQDGVNLYRPISLKNWKPDTISVASTSLVSTK